MRLTGAKCHCTVCDLGFGGERAFDRHRIVEVGQPDRHCLTEAELTKAGWSQDHRGFWLTPDPRRAGDGPQAPRMLPGATGVPDRVERGLCLPVCKGGAMAEDVTGATKELGGRIRERCDRMTRALADATTQRYRLRDSVSQWPPRGEQMDNVECAGRILARAFGCGRTWDTKYTWGGDHWGSSGEEPSKMSLGGCVENDDSSPVSDGLTACRETETLERAGDSVSGWLGREGAHQYTLSPEQRRARVKLTREEMESLWAWERQNQLNVGQRNNPRRPRELEHWKRTRSGGGVRVVRPIHAMDQDALEALSCIPTPLQDILLLYALQDYSYWPNVERYARAALPPNAHAGIEEGMYRLLKYPPKRARAKEWQLRESEWDAMSRPALQLFESWIARAADKFLQQLERPALSL